MSDVTTRLNRVLKSIFWKSSNSINFTIKRFLFIDICKYQKKFFVVKHYNYLKYYSQRVKAFCFHCWELLFSRPKSLCLDIAHYCHHMDDGQTLRWKSLTSIVLVKSSVHVLENWKLIQFSEPKWFTEFLIAEESYSVARWYHWVKVNKKF